MYKDFLEAAIAIAKEAGQLLRDSVSHSQQMHLKSSEADLVTETDRAAEALIVEQIQKRFPNHHILGEEGSAFGEGAFEYRWVVDPIDGTTNFAQGLPHFCVSIAVTDADMLPVVGVVYDPMRDECFSASKGGGAFLNEQAIHVTATSVLSESVVASGFPYDKWSSAENNVILWGQFAVRTRGIRRMGSAALDLAYVACGRFDGYWEQKLNPWDMMAGWLLVTEAGGTASDYSGEMAELLSAKPRMVASNGHIHKAMLAVIRDGEAAPRPV